jgi:hypothetical protein
VLGCVRGRAVEISTEPVEVDHRHWRLEFGKRMHRRSGASDNHTENDE